MSWEEPENDTNSICDIINYTVAWFSSELDVSDYVIVDTTNYSIYGLADNTEYNVTVTPNTIRGQGVSSEDISATTMDLCEYNMVMFMMYYKHSIHPNTLPHTYKY